MCTLLPTSPTPPPHSPPPHSAHRTSFPLPHLPAPYSLLLTPHCYASIPPSQVTCIGGEYHAFLLDLEQTDLSAKVAFSAFAIALRNRMRVQRERFNLDGFNFASFTSESLSERLSKLEPEHGGTQVPVHPRP